MCTKVAHRLANARKRSHAPPSFGDVADASRRYKRTSLIGGEARNSFVYWGTAPRGSVYLCLRCTLFVLSFLLFRRVHRFFFFSFPLFVLFFVHRTPYFLRRSEKCGNVYRERAFKRYLTRSLFFFFLLFYLFFLLCSLSSLSHAVSDVFSSSRRAILIIKGVDFVDEGKE